MQKSASNKPDHYWEIYSEVFADLRGADVRLLELGVAEGESLAQWLEFFPRGTIVGIDLEIPPMSHDESDRLRLYAGNQADTLLLERVAHDVAPEGFDIIIDDAAHVGLLAQTSFWYLFRNHLKSGGIYVLEDWATGYWPRWPDGAALEHRLPPAPVSDRERSPGFRSASRRIVRRLGIGAPPASSIESHQAGMVGLVKQILDGVAETDVRRGDSAAISEPLHIQRMLVSGGGQAFVYKDDL